MITAILYHLLKNTEKMTKLRKELDEKLGVGSFTGSGGGGKRSMKYPSFDVLQRLPYLDAVVKEAMRRFAVIRFTPERVTPPDGTIIDGFDVPGDVVVGANPWPVQHNREIYGEDVDVFRPERWLEEAGTEKYRVMNANLMLFGQGKYNCIGQNISRMEIYKVVAAIGSSFNVSSVIFFFVFFPSLVRSDSRQAPYLDGGQNLGG